MNESVLPPESSVPRRLQWGSQELNAGLPLGWQEPNHLSQEQCLPVSAISRKPGTEPRHLEVGHGQSNWSLNH